MAKGQKSSATAATRKKHAKKSVGDAKQELPLPKEKKKEKGKGKNKEPRVKVFIPPSKPAPVRPDPLDSLGIAKRLDPDLLIVLRRLAKKDSVTKRKALEELQIGWIDRVLNNASEEQNGAVESMLQTSLPVWLHHLPSLFLSASRRIRLLAASIHASFLRISSIHEQVIYFLQETGDAVQIEALLGSWCMVAEDVDRTVANQARQSWDLVFRSSSTSSSGIGMDDSSLNSLLVFTRRALFDPLALYTDVNPVQPAFTTPQHPAHASSRSKAAAKRPPLLQPVVDENSLARKLEEEEESESDRKGRLRVGALGVLRWVLEKENTSIQGQLSELLTSPLLWTALYHGPSPPFCDIQTPSGFIGDEQPLVRKTAWNILRSLLDHHNAYVQTLLPILSPAVLRSGWVEHDSAVRTSMWEALLKFLTQHPTAWEIDMTIKATADEDEDSEEESDREAPEDSGGEEDRVNEPLPPSTQSDAFREFLTFLSLGCYGSPVQGYPTVVIILSTVPPSMIGRDPEAWSTFITAFWAALDGRAFTSLASERAMASTAFLNALLEGIVLLVNRSRVFSEGTPAEDRSSRRQAIGAFIEQQFSRLWEELSKDRLRVQYFAASKALARTYTILGNMDELLFTMAWGPVTLGVTSSCSPQQAEPLSVSSKRFSLQLQLLRGLWEESQGISEANWPREVTVLICTIASVLAVQTDEQLDGIRRCKLRPTDVTAPQRLSEALTHFSSLIFSNSDLTSRIDATMSRSVIPILHSEPAMQLFLAFLLHRGDDAACLSLWRDALKVIAFDTNLQEEVLPVLLGASEKGDLPSRLRPEDGEMDVVATALVEDVLDVQGDRDSELRRTLLIRLLRKPYFFLSPRTASGVIHRIAHTFSQKSRILIHDSSSPGSLAPLRSPLMLLGSVIETRPDVALSSDIRDSLPDLFIFGYALPCSELLSSEAKALCLQARQIWTAAFTTEGLDPVQQNNLLASVRSLLRDLIADVDSRISPEAILQIVAEGHVGTSLDTLGEFFPTREALCDLLRDLPSNPLDPSLAIVDALVPPSSMWSSESQSRTRRVYDRTGLCEYARIVNALLGVATNNRDLVRRNMWLLRHFLILSISATDRYLIPAALSPYFSQDISADTLQEISIRVKTLTTFLLSGNDDEWHPRIVHLYLGGESELALSMESGLNSFILDFLQTVVEENDLRESRVLYCILRHMLNAAVTGGAEQWMILARRIERQSPHAASAIIRAVNESGLEPPSLDRYRNSAAAEMLGISASRAGTDGLTMLHRLALAAPDAESDVIFLPQNRVVRLIKACQDWFESDEDIEEDVESEMTLVFQSLAPILQNVPGAHWSFIFDIIENNLENSAFSDSSSLVVLARTLKLILIIQDLCRTNKSLRADWIGRELGIFTLVRDLVQNAPDSQPSEPRSICWYLAVSIIQSLPASLMDEKSLSKMAHLILDRSPEVAKMSYSLLYRAAQKRTEHLVVEAGVETSSENARYDIPTGLLRVLEDALQLDDSAEPNVFAYLLGWAIIFDLFDDASLRVKMSYATQLRDLDLIGSSFLPFIFDILELNGGRTRPLSLEPWSFEDYYVQFYDPETRLSQRLFAAHLYYRALLNVPSLIASWLASCKNRQLLTTVANFTTRYYSPVLIAAELRHIKDPAGVAELSGENWTIKVAAGIGEVTAAYTVDEQVMEIAIRLPVDYPLHGIEVRDVQKLGVDEKRWRGWLLAVQQIVTSQNGRIVDGLSMFKKNVTHHFENQTECAICYSIISVTELSLPKKRCKTCKNKFHAGCLYKWFNTSHTSTCPLCRSDFI